MAKRDKLYTVNKWNKPFFEQERRKKLYLWGGDSANPIYGLKTGQAGLRWGYGDTGGTDYTAPVSNLTKQNSLDRAVTTFNQYSNPSYYQDISKSYLIQPQDFQHFGGASLTTESTNTQDKGIKSQPSDVLQIATNATDIAKQLTNFFTNKPSVSGGTSTAASIGNVATPAIQTIGASTSGSPLKAVQNYLSANPELADKIKKVGENVTTKAGGISNLGKAGINIGASMLGKGAKYLLSNGLSTGVGEGIGTVADLASSAVQFIPGVGWAAAPIIAFAGNALAGAYNGAFGSKTYDNGATAYTNRLNALNPNGSNEYLANLMANTGIGPRATYKDGWLRDKGKNEAAAINNAQDLAFNRFQRGIRDAFQNNNTRQLWNAYNDYVTYGAMGGKIKRKKCNCKATGGFLNNAMLDSASATGYNFLSDLTNMQMQNNQNKQDMGSSLGNSFTGLSNGTLFANGGGININPAHKGEFTAKAKRHGMGVQQFASYVLAHKDKFPTSTIRQAVFAKNSNTWKKAFGGKLNYGKDKDIRNSGFFDGQTLYAIGGPLQAMSSNWSPGGNVTEINAGGQHETNPYQGVQVGVDPEGTPNLVEENEVIWNDYVFSNRLKVPKEVCKELRVGQKKDGFTFAEVAKKLLKESKERPNDPISKRGLDANMQKLEDAQEELKQKMEAEEAVEQFNSLPPEQQVAIMQQEGEKAQDAVAQDQMAQEIQNLPPEQQQAIAQQMAMEQAQQQGMPQGMSPEEQYAMQQQAMQDQAAQEQYAQQRDARNQEILAQAAAMQDQAINSSAMGGKLCFGGRKFAEGGELNGQPQAEPGATQQDTEMAKYSDEELQDMIDDYQEAESGEVKVTKGKLARLRKKAEKAQAELERRHAEENEEQPQEARQEPSQEELQAAAQEQAMQAQQPIEGQPQEGMSPEQAMMMQQQMGDQQMSPEEMATMELQQQGNGQYAYGGKVNKYAYAGPLKPQPTSPFTEAQGAIYGKRPDIPQEVYDWFISLTPDERFDLFGGTDFWPTGLKDYNEDPNNWYNDYKKNPSSPNRKYWRAAVTNEESVDRDNSDWHTIVLDAYKNRRDSSGKYIPYNLSQDIIHWYANLPEDERKKIVANTKMKGKDFSTVVEYANKGAAGPVTEAIVNAYNAANGDSSTSTINSPDGQIVGGAQQTIPTSSIDYAPYFRGMTTNDIFGQIWDQMSSERRNGISRKDFIANNSNLPTNGWSSYNDELLNVYYNLHPEARNSGWTFDSNPYRTYANVDFHDATSAGGNNGNKMVAENFYTNDPAWNQLTEQQRQLKGNELAAALEATQAYKDFSQYLRNNRTSQYVKDYFTELANRGSKIAKNALADWDNMTDSKFDAVIKNLREDASAPPNSPGNKNNNALGLGHFTPAFAENWTNRYWVKDADGNYSQIIGGIADADKDKYIAINTNPYQVTVDNNNYNDYYYRLKTDAEQADSSKGSDTSNYLTVGWQPKTDWASYALGAMPGLTGLGMMLGRGAPDMSGLDEAVAAYERNTGTMVAPHLTHGLIRPAIIDPRITRNSMNQSRLGTNRLLMNTGASPSRGATILANDANSINQLGQAMIENWKANRAQEQAAAAFNRETNTTNANILNQVDQFNAQTQSALARDAAQLRYRAASDKIAARDAYYQGLIGNLGSIMSGVNEAYKQNQRKNERDLLLASGVFGETNPFLENYYGISKVDPNTGQVVRGYNTGMYYWINPNTGKPEYLKTKPSQPSLAINAKGGKLKRNKKRKGYTF